MEKVNEIKCPNCEYVIDIADIIKAGAKDEVNKMLEIQQKKYQQKLEQMKNEKENLLKSATKRMDEVKTQLEKDYKEKLFENEKILKEKIAEEQSLLTKRLQEELDEKTQKLKQMIELEAQNLKLKREKESMKEEFELELQKKLSEQILTEKTKLKQAIDAENELVIIQYKKQLEDQGKLIEEMKRKYEQGSMQLQGEVQELAIEQYLKEQFILDEIQGIGKGKQGADVLQVVNTRECLNCGKIYYESKRTKTFGKDWIEKFKNNCQEKGADIGVLVTQVYPHDMERMGLKDGIYICSYAEFKGLVVVLRETIIKLNNIINAQDNRHEKTALLYNYLTGNEFKTQFENIINAFVTMKSDLEKEKSVFQREWAKREKQLELVLNNTTAMIGSIQGIAGSSIETKELLSIGTLLEEEEQ